MYKGPYVYVLLKNLHLHAFDEVGGIEATTKKYVICYNKKICNLL